MDPKLAEAYQTEEALQNEAEALATLGMAEKLAAAEELNVDGMSDEEAEALAASILGDEEAPEQEESAQEQDEDEEKTASQVEQEKVAEAEHLGRVMAHAFVNERAKIAQAAAEKSKTASKKAGKVMGALKKKASAEAPEQQEEAKPELSKLDQLALARAQEILKENGIELEGEEKQASIPEEKVEQLQAKVQSRAEEMLREAGYSFDSDETETDEK